MHPKTLKRAIPIERKALFQHLEEIDRVLVDSEVDAPIRHKVRLAIEELIMNLCMHSDLDEHTSAQLCLNLDHEQYELTIEDPGPAFNPWEQPNPIVDTGIEDREIGGLGLLLIKESATSVSYQRTVNGQNRVRVEWRKP